MHSRQLSPVPTAPTDPVRSVVQSTFPRLRGHGLPFGEDVEVAREDALGAVELRPVVGIGAGSVLLEDLGVRVVGRADDDRGADRLAVDLEVDVVVLPPLEADGVGGEGPDLLAVDRDGDGDVPAGVEVAVGVGDVDLGLEGAGGRVEREARADDLALAGGARDRLEADQGRVAARGRRRRPARGRRRRRGPGRSARGRTGAGRWCRRRAGGSRPG